MKYISLNFSTLNNADSISDLVSAALMFCDTEMDNLEYLEFNIIHDDYLIKHSGIDEATKILRELISSERISCYLDNLVSYVSMHLMEHLSLENGQIHIITNNCVNRINILNCLFNDYEIEVFNIPNYLVDSNGSHREICERQSVYFKKFHDISK